MLFPNCVSVFSNWKENTLERDNVIRQSKSASDTSGSCRACCAGRAALLPKVSQYERYEAGRGGIVVVCSLQVFLVVEHFKTLNLLQVWGKPSCLSSFKGFLTYFSE